MSPVTNLIKLGILSLSLTALRCDEATTPVETPPQEQPPITSPSVLSVSPRVGSPDGGTALVITGTNFDSSTRLFIAGVEVTRIERLSKTMLLASSPASPGKHGSVDVTVMNSDGGTSTNSRVFSYYSSTFQFSAEATFGAGMPVVGDFNGDGKLDLAVISPATESSSSIMFSGPYGLQLVVHLGNGDGTFQDPLPTIYLGCEFPTILQAGDVDGDGRSDLLVANHHSSTLLILFAQADGSFLMENNMSESIQFQEVGLPCEPESIALGDVDGDGIMDLVVATRSSDDHSKKDIRTYLGAHNRAFTNPIVVTVPESGAEWCKIGLRLADVNGDGKLDMVYILENTATLTVGLGKGDGTFEWLTSIVVGKTDPSSLVVADVNGDGKLDVVAMSKEASVYSYSWGVSQHIYLAGKGDGTFDVKPNITFDLLVTSFVVADINGDGAADLIALRKPEDKFFYVGLGKGDGTWQDRQSFLTTEQVGSSIVLGDFDGDGKLDMVLPGTEGGVLTVFHNTAQ